VRFESFSILMTDSMVKYKANGCLLSLINTSKNKFFNYFFIILPFLFLKCAPDSISEQFYIPADFEEQEAVWMGCQGRTAFKQVRNDIVKALLPYVKIKIVSPSHDILSVCKNFLETDRINTNMIDFIIMKDNEFWMRDHGATFVINQKGDMKVIDFEWSDYGYEEWLRDYYSGDEQQVRAVMRTLPENQKKHIDSLMAVYLQIPVEKSWIRIEGGMMETNGKGTLMLNEPLTLSRNYGATKDSIAKELNRVLGISNIIWLKEGLAEDPHICETIIGNYVGIGTGGHIDEYARFADSHTILLAWVPEEEKELNPINALNYKRMKINYEILKNSKDIDGKKYKIIKVPLPDPIITKIRINKEDQWDGSLNIPELMFKPKDGWKVGDTANRIASASYLNYFITNHILLLPTYIHVGSSQKKEDDVKKIFQNTFPDRKITFINALPLNWRGGGIHCTAAIQPKRHISP
jgi:agmatine deiminase